jgi:hypothetical protein
LIREESFILKKTSGVLCILLLLTLTGCIESEKETDDKQIDQLIIKTDIPCILPDWQDGQYHDYYDSMNLLTNLQIQYPNQVNLFSIGESVLGKDIWCIRITNERNSSEKKCCLIDGCIHGDEWESGESCLYLAEYLLINFEKNMTIQKILNSSKIYIIPILNPDGRQANSRFTDNGVDPNRNFDVFFGKLRGKCVRLGKILGRIKIPVIKLFSQDPFEFYWNCGRKPFSEPETQALRDLTKSLNKNDFSFYVNSHTSLHNVVTPWISYKPPFEMTQQEIDVFDYVVTWVQDNTEYDAFRGQGFEYKTGGLAMDWCFKKYRIPSFTFEILTPEYHSQNYDPLNPRSKHDHLVHWMKTTIPFYMYLLVNIENLHNWKTPDINPPLPEGIPPEPLT